MIYRVLAALAVIAVIATGFLLAERRQARSARPAGDEPTTVDAGYAARNAEIVETGSDGRPLYTLRASTIRQLPNDETVALEDVWMEFRDTSGNVWTARADHGRILEDAAHVRLRGAVQVSGVLPGAGGQQARITTEQLSFDTRSEIVRTHAPVRLDWSGRQLSALGLVASLKAHHVRLESNVHGLFPP